MSVRGPEIHTVDERYYEGLVACAVCRFWMEVPGGTIADHEGECRRLPPVPSVIRFDDGDWLTLTRWPGTDRDSWCGEFCPLTPTPAPNPEAVSQLTSDQVAALQKLIRSVDPGEIR